MKTIYDLTNDEILNRVKYISNKYSLGVSEVGIGKDKIGRVIMNILYDYSESTKKNKGILFGYTALICDENGNDLWDDENCPYTDFSSPYIIVINKNRKDMVEMERESLERMGDVKWYKI